MRADQDLIQSAVVLTFTVVGALLDGAFNTVVCFAVHCSNLLFLISDSIMEKIPERKPGIKFQILKSGRNYAIVKAKTKLKEI